MAAVKTPKRVQKIIDQCQRGETLVVTFVNKRSGASERVYTLSPSGREVGPDTAKKVIEGEYLRPRGDCLFDGLSQTYGL